VVVKAALSEVEEPVWRARVSFCLQKSTRGVWLREATPVAAGVGDGGLAQTWETTESEVTS
jgi:hypothetical protein